MLGHASAIECSRQLMSLGIDTLDKKDWPCGGEFGKGRGEARERRMAGRIDPLLVEGGEWVHSFGPSS